MSRNYQINKKAIVLTLQHVATQSSLQGPFKLSTLEYEGCLAATRCNSFLNIFLSAVATANVPKLLRTTLTLASISNPN